MDSPFNTSRSISHESQDVLPASLFLQERLQERRARNTRPKRARQSDFGPRRGRDDDIFMNEAEESKLAARRFDSSPLVDGSRALSDIGATASGNRRRTMGVRDLDEQLDRLNKENFALKLELDHRRDHTVKLQQQLEDMTAQVDRAEKLETEHAELLRINSQLVEELEKRDKAVEEAMDIICDLEDRVAELDERACPTRPSTANADSGYAGTETLEQVPPSSPPDAARPPKTPQAHWPAEPPLASAAAAKLFSAVNRETPAKSRREPIVFSQQKPSTNALRSVYMETTRELHPVKSFNSLLSKRDRNNEDEADLTSPRLSVLSEGSFASMYSPKKDMTPEKFVWETPDAASNTDHRQDSINRVSRWIDDGAVLDDTPSKIKRMSIPVSEIALRPTPVPSAVSQSRDVQLQPLVDAVASTSSTAQRRLTPGLDDGLRRTGLRNDSRPTHRDGLKPKSARPSSIAGPIFGDLLLSPNPESEDARMLRASRSSIVDERSLLDDTPLPVRSFQALEPGLRTAPKQMRSSVELKSAFLNNLQHRSTNPLSSSSEGDDDDGEFSAATLHASRRHDEGDFPDGKSILTGTPSRFLTTTRSHANNLLFDGNDLSPPGPATSPRRRRQSSSEASTSPWRSNLNRGDNGPFIFGNLGKIVTQSSKSTMNSTIMSPKSANSGSPSSRTGAGPMTADEVNGPLSPEPAPGRLRNQAVSPARSLGQKTQMLFRRLSATSTDSPRPNVEPRSPREKSPLPTLTSTPSSAYLNTVSKEARRPSTSEASKQFMVGSPIGMPRPPSTRGERRPSVVRHKTEPSNAWPASAINPERSGSVLGDREKKTLFRRTNSIKQATPTDAETIPPLPSPSPAPAAFESEPLPSRGVLTKRRGSIRDAVVGSARRPWR